MYLSRLVLQHFRSYQQEVFEFDRNITLVVGQNTAGKTNLVEALHLLSFGKSFRTEKDMQMIRFEEEIARTQALIQNSKSSSNNGINEKVQTDEEQEEIKLEVMLAQGSVTGGRFTKKFLVNDVGKRRVDFEGVLPLVLFSPEELDIVIAGPSLRRRFLDDVLEQVDKEYRLARILYDKALKQRNALLSLAKETGARLRASFVKMAALTEQGYEGQVRNKDQFVYWDELLITNGALITKKREDFLSFINCQKKDIFSCTVVYDKSIISEERLLQYQEGEIGSGVTLVGPHRDDFFVHMQTDKDVRYYGSRGQQRLVVLQLKLLQIQFMSEALRFRPLLVLDDIFSELDKKNTALVLDMISRQQTIVTTANKDVIPEERLKKMSVIELKQEP